MNNICILVEMLYKIGQSQVFYRLTNDSSNENRATFIIKFTFGSQRNEVGGGEAIE